MSKGYINFSFIIYIMLIPAINFICSKDNNFSRRDVLIETLKNAEKLARYDERITFLCECCRSDIYPKFIHSLGCGYFYRRLSHRKCHVSYCLM